jgi:hypothetical protein
MNMDHTSLKRSVLKAARTHLENTVAELKERIADLRSVTIGDDNAESASQTESTRGSDVELMNSLGEQLTHVEQDLERLSKIEPTVHLDQVQYGAVVHTDQRNFLIAVSMDDFDAGGKEYLGVTTKAPVVQALSGLKVGGKATVNGVTYAIQDIC